MKKNTAGIDAETASRYQHWMARHDEALENAIRYYRAGDLNMASFYRNAAIGFRRKALDGAPAYKKKEEGL